MFTNIYKVTSPTVIEKFVDNVAEETKALWLDNPEKYKFSQEKRRKFRESIDANETDYLVVHVGAFLQEKNHRFLIKVFSEFNKTIPKSKLILILWLTSCKRSTMPSYFSATLLFLNIKNNVELVTTTTLSKSFSNRILGYCDIT